MSEVWFSGCSHTEIHKGETIVYPDSCYRGPTSSSEVFFMFRSTLMGGLQWMNESSIGESLGAILHGSWR